MEFISRFGAFFFLWDGTIGFEEALEAEIWDVRIYHSHSLSIIPSAEISSIAYAMLCYALVIRLRGKVAKRYINETGINSLPSYRICIPPNLRIGSHVVSVHITWHALDVTDNMLKKQGGKGYWLAKSLWRSEPPVR